MSAYENGTIATATVRGIPGIRVMRQHGSGHQRWICSDFPEGDGGGTLIAYDTEVTDIRPLVVLDLNGIDVPEFIDDLRGGLDGVTANAVADQIEVQTKPPKPAEPTGLGAVVEALNGMLWIAARPLGCDISARWRSWPAGMWHPYEDIDAVRVLSEGVQGR